MEYENMILLMQLIKDLITNRIEVHQFCLQYENIYNFQINEERIDVKYRKGLRNIFDYVIRYSPFEYEIKEYKCYYGDEEIKKIVKQIADEMNI